MAVSRRQPSARVSNGLSAATVALNIAGAATDAVPIAKQILNSAVHISAVAERIQKKREAMDALILRAEIYSTQIDMAIAGRVLDARLQPRLARLLSVFVKIEALVEEKASRRKYPARLWNKFIAKPNRAEELAAELDQEMTLFNLLTGIQLTLTVEDTARAVEDTARTVEDTARTVEDTARITAEDARYDGEFRRLRNCDMEKIDVIHKHKTDTEVIVWSSARVDGQLMVVRHVEPVTRTPSSTTKEVARHQSLPASYNEYLENIEKISTISGSHRYIVQLYGRHVRGPEAVFKSGTIGLYPYLRFMSASKTDAEKIAVEYLRLAYKMLDASAHLEDVHGLAWVGLNAVVDENGEPRIGLFSDIVRPDRPHLPPSFLGFYWNFFCWFNPRHPHSEETGVVEQVHNSSLHAIITEQFRDGNDTDRLQRVWDIVWQKQLHVSYDKRTFPIISGNLSLSQELIARARSYFETSTNLMDRDLLLDCVLSFTRHVLDISSQICVRMCHIKHYIEDYRIEVDACTHDENHIQYHWFWIYIPAGCPLLAEVARAVGLPDDFEHSWIGRSVQIYPQVGSKGEQMEEESEIGDGEGADQDSANSDPCGNLEEEDEEYETADEGETSSEAAGEE